MAQNEIHSFNVTRGSRTYFFDINKSMSGDLYLKISESKKTDAGFEHHRLMIFEEDVTVFAGIFQKSVEHLKSLKVKKPIRSGSQKRS
ncbi:MAG: DUF3276 family protein [Flavobacterium sp.]|uniref:DUF3276 family protein n=1 Tax=Flavobacterium sp. TaxID=239 RepID=UPI00120CA972|nr:DUF3276 family protein [Flavobacterium sp.]RZJ63341.1 MAG: DUF3276 family protein [Flavobacterium sp.]